MSELVCRLFGHREDWSVQYRITGLRRAWCGRCLNEMEGRS